MHSMCPSTSHILPAGLHEGPGMRAGRQAGTDAQQKDEEEIGRRSPCHDPLPACRSSAAPQARAAALRVPSAAACGTPLAAGAAHPR